MTHAFWGVTKPSQEELQDRVEFLAKKKRSAKRKVPAAPESSHAARGKVPKLGASSSPSTILERGSSGQFWARGQTPHPVAEVTGPQLRSPHATVTKSLPRSTVEPTLDILPISVWSPLAQSAELPSRASESEGRKHLGHERDKDSLLANAELATGACRLSYGILTLRRWILCPSGRLWLRRFRERLWSVQTPLLLHPIIDFDWFLPLSCFCKWLPT